MIFILIDYGFAEFNKFLQKGQKPKRLHFFIVYIINKVNIKTQVDLLLNYFIRKISQTLEGFFFYQIYVNFFLRLKNPEFQSVQHFPWTVGQWTLILIYSMVYLRFYRYFAKIKNIVNACKDISSQLTKKSRSEPLCKQTITKVK